MNVILNQMESYDKYRLDLGLSSWIDKSIKSEQQLDNIETTIQGLK